MLPFKLSSFRFLLWAALLTGGFLAGVAWKAKDNRPASPPETTDSTAVPVAEKTRGSEAAPRGELTAEEKATIRLFEEAAPSVCFITTSNVRMDFFSRNVTEIPSGTGSGFVWDRKGHIVTNYHVIQRADRAQVTLGDRSSWPARLVGVAPEKDLAVLQIEAPAEILSPIPIGTSEDLRVGQSVFAIGNPFGLDQTLTTGIVSALGREIESGAGIPIRDVIQTDAAINPGNSGGPLLDSSGRLIGVNTAIYSPSGASAGIGFSIPADVVRWVVPELILHGRLQRLSLGVEVARRQITQRLGLSGVLVIDVIPGGPADRAGIRPTTRDRYGAIQLGDLIVGIEDEKIESYSDMVLALEQFQAGDRVKVRILRDDRPLETELELEIGY